MFSPNAVKKAMITGAVGILAVAGLAAAGASPAAADGTVGPLCNIVDPAEQHTAASLSSTTERIVTPGHQFRAHNYPGVWDGTRQWVWGHSGESWWDDGWVVWFSSSGEVNLSC